MNITTEHDILNFLYYDYFKREPRVTTDTRRIESGSVFFALKGASFDGNKFAKSALDAGCAYAVVDDAAVAAEDERIFCVPDALRALQNLAALHRREMALPILQITGTNGKTTTKELCAAVLSKKYNILYTQGNLNNHIGVPQTLLRLRPENELAVVETGANHPGEIADLSRIVQANCGLITNVGKAHLEGFGSFEGVVRTKTELYADLRTREGSLVFLNADDDILANRVAGLKTVTYSSAGRSADVEGELIACDPFLRYRWRRAGGQYHEVQTQLIGSYNIANALAATAVGIHFGVSEEAISEAIAAYAPTNSRSELRRTERNKLIVDAYNANPTSMRAALENFRLLPDEHKMMILGSMKELGAASAQEHSLLVSMALCSGAEEVWLVGEEFRPYAEGCRFFADVDAVSEELRTNPLEGKTILLKGSNSTRLHQLPSLL